ncbi:1-deoxy-D-xylulose-5-phosphate reductoisomerase [Dyadobacter sp. CY107]|uniref:1-deoxy-D-xylulose-5-phosphate reductoisomerase n=1 Tax=Dyadobacter fanqingshengii TaxID=2906443 RepID=UPI001F22B950|nr:1-deoxy-D-xylulose-5-phosphate reductoisomerase [Dyadobacter fanqingshengii]MCF2504156.1 1-deoxy-D-xylulose-5-phosphate reductoisomerase [Dyadobacter fanqingshengii]
MKKNIAILGSTGSIGTQALEVMEANPEIFSVSVLTAQENADLLIEQASKFLPKAVVIGNEKYFDKVKSALSTFNIHVYSGIEALVSVVESDDIDTVLTAMVGYAGLLPTIHAIKAGKDIALANKETLVVAGELITGLARQCGVNIYPVDSEHSAIFQCLVGEEGNRIEKIILTASGGPFRGKDRAYLAHVTREQALKHPNWSMGAKITIDSATLMNKGLEVIEAKWLFDLEASQIDVIVHPQSIVHSLVQFEDGSIKAQMGLPDMKLPIQYALRYPARLKSAFPRFNFTDYPSLTFEKPDLDTFRNLAIAYEVLEKGGNAACIVNAANEIAVEAFLQGKIGFLDISDLIVESLAKISYISTPTYSDYVQTNEATRRFASELIQVKV